MLDQTAHYIEAERLLGEGEEVVRRIGALADVRERVRYGVPGDDPGEYARCTAHMDELGKKAMGIWAQAQVHATLAHVPDTHVGALLDLSRR